MKNKLVTPPSLNTCAGASHLGVVNRHTRRNLKGLNKREKKRTKVAYLSTETKDCSMELTALTTRSEDLKGRHNGNIRIHDLHRSSPGINRGKSSLDLISKHNKLGPRGASSNLTVYPESPPVTAKTTIHRRA